MILALQTASSTTRLWLLVNEQASPNAPILEWDSGRELSDKLLDVLVCALEKANSRWEDVTGIIIFSGPGSFTSLRIGHATANALADSLDIPVVGTQSEDWIAQGLKLLPGRKPGQPALPYYGSEAHITRPKA